MEVEISETLLFVVHDIWGYLYIRCCHTQGLVLTKLYYFGRSVLLSSISDLIISNNSIDLCVDFCFVLYFLLFGEC